MCIWTFRRKMDLKLENIPVVVLACFVLHNVSEFHNDNIYTWTLLKHKWTGTVLKTMHT